MIQKVKIISSTPRPQYTIYAAMHQCYSENYIGDESAISEKKAGEIIVEKLLKGNRGHYGPLEHPQITFACGGFAHSVMQQARTHRIGISFDCQSNRYTGNRLLQAAKGERDIEEVIYLRPVGSYVDRHGESYSYTQEQRDADLAFCMEAVRRYKTLIDEGVSQEQARGIIPFDVRQHFVVSFNMRSLMHFLDLRAKKDAQYEIRELAFHLMELFKKWSPEVADWYEVKRWEKASLAP